MFTSVITSRILSSFWNISSCPPAGAPIIDDICNHNYYTNARLPGSVNLSVPSTLLKRPAFVLAKLAEMIPSGSDRRTFAAWGRSQHIVVYDADTSVLAPTNNVAGLLRKFQHEGFRGTLGYVVGGFNAVLRHQPGSVDNTPIDPEALADEDDDEDGGYPGPEGSLATRRLPPSAFLQCESRLSYTCFFYFSRGLVHLLTRLELFSA